MKIESVIDYYSALAEQERFRGILERGRNEFSGYGLELFERGIQGLLQRIGSAIQEYETLKGYTCLAPRDFWFNRMCEDLMVPTSGKLGMQSTFATTPVTWTNSQTFHLSSSDAKVQLGLFTDAVKIRNQSEPASDLIGNSAPRCSFSAA